MIQTKILFFITGTIWGLVSFSQTSDRRSNPDYMWTSLYETFDGEQLDRNTWKVSNPASREKGLFIWADSVSTINQTNGSLHLSMRRAPGHKAVHWNGDTITADFIAGQVQTKNYFSYGIYECNAVFASKRGSFPAFWLYNDYMCDESYRNEIDIVELKRDFIAGTLDNAIWFYPENCMQQEIKDFKRNWFINWDVPHTFKCVWTPDKIEYRIDNEKLHEVVNDNYEGFPDLPLKVILSQQIVRFGWIDPEMERIITPQTSEFNWIRVREFFLAPEIDYIRESGSANATATLDVDSLAQNIKWYVSPKELFEGATSGTGKKAAFTFSEQKNSEAEITFIFGMPDGKFYEAEKTFLTKPTE